MDKFYVVMLGMPAICFLLASITGSLSSKSGRKSVPISNRGRLLCLFLAILFAATAVYIYVN